MHSFWTFIHLVNYLQSIYIRQLYSGYENVRLTINQQLRFETLCGSFPSDNHLRLGIYVTLNKELLPDNIRLLISVFFKYVGKVIVQKSSLLYTSPTAPMIKAVVIEPYF